MSYYLRGELKDSFYMVGVDLENTNYLFGGRGVMAPGNSSGGFYHPDNFSDTSLKPSTLTYKDTLYLGAFRFVQDSTGSLGLTGSASTSPILSLKNQDYSGNLIQTGVMYTMMNSLNEPVYFPVITTNGNLEIIKSIRFVPLMHYASGDCSLTSTLPSELQFIQNPLTFTSRGFTTLTDCKNKFFYNYCFLGDSCGDSNCFGGCKGGGVCQLKNKTFQCVKSRTRSPRPAHFHIGLITIFLTALLLFIFLLIAENRS